MSKSSDKSDKLSIKLTKTQHEQWIELRKVLAKKTDKDLYLYLVDFYVTFKDKVVEDALRPFTKPPPPLRADFIDELSSSDDDGDDGSAMYLLSADAYKKTLIRNEDTAHSAETFCDDDVVKPREAMTLIQLPSAMMDEPDSMSALNTTSLNNDDDVKTKSSEPLLLNSIKREEATYEARESTNFEDNLSKCGMNSLNELFVTKKDVIKIEEDEDSGGGGGGGEFDDEEDLMEELFGEEEESMEEDDDDDDEYLPPSPALNGESDSDDEIDASSDETDDKENSVNHPVIVYKDCLLELAEYIPTSRCDECDRAIKMTPEITGSKISLTWTCPVGHFVHTWNSQPTLRKRTSLGDIALASAIVLTGLEFDNMCVFFHSLQLPFLNKSSFYNFKRKYVIPVINATWQKEVKQNVIEEESENNGENESENYGVVEESQKDGDDERTQNVENENGESHENRDNEERHNIDNQEAQNNSGDNRIPRNNRRGKKGLQNNQDNKKPQSCRRSKRGLENNLDNEKTQNNGSRKNKSINDGDNEKSQNKIKRGKRGKRGLQIDKDNEKSQNNNNGGKRGSLNDGDNPKTQNNGDGESHDDSDYEKSQNRNTRGSLNAGDKRGPLNVGDNPKTQNNRDGESEDSDSDSDNENDNENDNEEKYVLFDTKRYTKKYTKKLADIDLHYNKDRGQYVAKDGRKCWIRKKNKRTKHVSVYRKLERKQYTYIPKMVEDVLTAFSTKNASLQASSEE